jgi:hypothetical protein
MARIGILILLLAAAVQNAWADVRITNMNNIGLGTWNGSGDMQSDDDVCVFNDAGPGYLITASGNGGGSFHLSSGANTVSYDVQFKGSSGSFSTLSPNNSHPFSSADQLDEGCGGGSNATIRIRVPENSLLDAQKGSYSGTLNVQVDPN